jgi:hypothetical protein
MLSAMFESTTGLKLRDLIENSRAGANGSIVNHDEDAPPPIAAEIVATREDAPANGEGTATEEATG